MPLFLDRFPLHAWIPPASLARLPVWSASVPVIVTDPGLPAPPPRARPQRWAIDTRFSGEAYAWRHHLIEAGLDPDVPRTGATFLTPIGGSPRPFPLRDADLWLCSNIPGLQDRAWRLELDEGIAVHDAVRLPDPEINRPLLGMRALVGSGLTVELDLARNTLSLWTPGPWYQSLTLSVRRVLSGFSRIPPPWSQRADSRGTG